MKTSNSQKKHTNLDVEAYLARLSVTRKDPSLKYLRVLQKAHLSTIPFENLDIHYGQKIILDYQQIFQKIIVMQRGGFCYELNGLFFLFLKDLGFETFVISAEVFNLKNEKFGKPFDHLALVVSIDGNSFLVDVGFGSGPIQPLEIRPNYSQMAFNKYWRFEKDADERFILKSSKDNSIFTSEYRFTLEKKQLIQFLEMCEYHQTSSDSSFTQGKLITKLTNKGQVTLTDKKLKMLDSGKIQEEDILNEDYFLSKLDQYFNISFEQLIRKENKYKSY